MAFYIIEVFISFFCLIHALLLSQALGIPYHYLSEPIVALAKTKLQVLFFLFLTEKKRLNVLISYQTRGVQTVTL